MTATLVIEYRDRVLSTVDPNGTAELHSATVTVLIDRDASLKEVEYAFRQLGYAAFPISQEAMLGMTLDAREVARALKAALAP